MTVAHALVDLECPHCQQTFVENAALVRPWGTAWCSECGRSFHLDPNAEATARMLQAAKAARRERRQRVSDFRSLLNEPVPRLARADSQRLMGDVLSTLDGLLERLDNLHRRHS